MSYYRLYASKTNTIFQRNSGTVEQTAGTINTGQSPISEISTGNVHSRLLLNFTLEELYGKLQANNYAVNLVLYDAGVIFDNSTKLLPVDLYYFEENFTEGDGFSYNIDGLVGYSNFINRDSSNLWGTTFDKLSNPGDFPIYSLNTANEDLKFDVKRLVELAITNTVDNFNFAIDLDDSSEPIESAQYTKFIYTRHTRTTFQPYLEFFIEDDIVTPNEAVATIAETFFIKNENGIDFIGTLTAEVLDEDSVIVNTPSITSLGQGVYNFTYTPDISLAKKTIEVSWKIDGTVVKTSFVKILSPNSFSNNTLISKKDLFFFPTTRYASTNIQKGDKVKILITSEIRGKGVYTSKNFEYRVVATNGFEMIPWSQVNLYNNELYTIIDTSFFYEGLDYEVFVRLNENNEIKTSNLTYKFKVVESDYSPLRNKNASPYSNRNYGKF